MPVYAATCSTVSSAGTPPVPFRVPLVGPSAFISEVTCSCTLPAGVAIGIRDRYTLAQRPQGQLQEGTVASNYCCSAAAVARAKPLNAAADLRRVGSDPVRWPFLRVLRSLASQSGCGATEGTPCRRENVHWTGRRHYRVRIIGEAGLWPEESINALVQSTRPPPIGQVESWRVPVFPLRGERSSAGLAATVAPVTLVAGGVAPPARSTPVRAASAASRVWSSPASGGIFYA